MKRRLTIRHLLAALALLGLVLGPVFGPVAAPAMATPMPVDMTASATTDMTMSDAMPCCPDAPAKSDCQKVCPFMAICAGLIFSGPATGAALAAPTTLLATIAPHDDAKRNGLGQAPPPRPPKASLV